MIIREATGKDVFDLKELYFVYLTKWPPKEEQNMEQWAQMLEDFRKKDSFYNSYITINNSVYTIDDLFKEYDELVMKVNEK